jgi:phosphonatase-like hydrolase
MSQKIEMVVFDMAGTTVRDDNEVENCFREAIEHSGLSATHEQINSMMGWSKRQVFETLWKMQLPKVSEEEINSRTDHSYAVFKNILEKHYRNGQVNPAQGCLEIFGFLRERNIKIALTTGFYRKVADIILHRLGWNGDLNIDHAGNGIINASVTSDQVKAGRPAPFMVFRAMELCCVTDVRKIVKIGDTPSDLSEGKNAGCKFTIGITNGSHSRSQLEKHEHDGLVSDLNHFRYFLETIL